MARSEERRAEILRATLEVIAERGYRGASLGAVAERVGLTQQGLLHYFPTKEALLVAVMEERDQWDAVPGTGLRLDLLGQLVEYNAMRPGIVQTFSALLGESVTEGHPAREFFTERYETVRANMAQVLRAEFGEPAAGRAHAGASRSAARRGDGRAAVPVAARAGVGGHAGGVPGLPHAAGRRPMPWAWPGHALDIPGPWRSAGADGGDDLDLDHGPPA